MPAPLRLIAACLLAACLLATVAAGSAASPPSPPNVLLIIADDLAQSDLGCYGHPYHHTPHLDALADRSLRFTHAYAASPVCSPTRASIFTGRAPASLGLTDWIPGAPFPYARLARAPSSRQLPAEVQTLPRFLRGRGYSTSLVGKWHLGPAASSPHSAGFDRAVATLDLGNPDYFAPYENLDLPDAPPGEYLTDRLTDESLRILAARGDRPFFLCLSHYAPHVPLAAKSDLVAHYQTELARIDSISPGQLRDAAVYAAMLHSLDDSVGRLLDYLAQNQLADNTVVIFLSDNGGLDRLQHTHRAGKGTLYEGGLRIPLVIHLPPSLENQPAAAVSHVPVITHDLFPTLAALLPHDPDTPANEQNLDGADLSPLLRDPSADHHLADRRLAWYYPHYNVQGGRPAAAIRVGTFKLIEHFEDARLELFDLEADPHETTNLCESDPGRAAALHAHLRTVLADGNLAPLGENPDYDPACADLAYHPRFLTKRRKLFAATFAATLLTAATAVCVAPTRRRT